MDRPTQVHITVQNFTSIVFVPRSCWDDTINYTETMINFVNFLSGVPLITDIRAQYLPTACVLLRETLLSPGESLSRPKIRRQADNHSIICCLFNLAFKKSRPSNSLNLLMANVMGIPHRDTPGP